MPEQPPRRGSAPTELAPDGQQFQVVGGMWADDSRHLCVIASQPDGWILVTEIPGYSEEFVNLPKVGQTVISVIACSVRNDRAILVRTMNSAIRALGGETFEWQGPFAPHLHDRLVGEHRRQQRRRLHR
jgi:hypothetical protein